MSDPTDEPDGGDDGDRGRDDSTGTRPMAWWDDVLADVAARVEEYEADGWDALALHPGDVTPLHGQYGEDVGLDVLLPDNEFADLTATLDAVTIDHYEVYRTEVAGYVAALVTAEATEDETAVVLPVYYARENPAARHLFELAVEAGELTVFVRKLSEDRVTLTLERPDLLVPEDFLEA